MAGARPDLKTRSKPTAQAAAQAAAAQAAAEEDRQRRVGRGRRRDAHGGAGRGGVRGGGARRGRVRNGCSVRKVRRPRRADDVMPSGYARHIASTWRSRVRRRYALRVRPAMRFEGLAFRGDCVESLHSF
jgi:hypothetical protein